MDAWEQCKDAKILLESPYAMGGVHIAEALSESNFHITLLLDCADTVIDIPYFRVCTMPWTKYASNSLCHYSRLLTSS